MAPKAEGSRLALAASALPRRQRWLTQVIPGCSGHAAVENALVLEVNKDGIAAVLDHLHLCGAIPEAFGPSSSEEKLYSRYTDSVVAAALRAIGMTAKVLTTRANSADVEATATGYSLVADAKAFRLSRTAKNQKDFKVEAMAGWKGAHPHGLVVCPAYQLPATNSQIYHQALSRSVTIITYSHLAALVQLANTVGHSQAQQALLSTMTISTSLAPTQSATAYWKALNSALINSSPSLKTLLADEQQVNLEGLDALRKGELAPLVADETAIRAMSQKQAQDALLKDRRIDSRIAGINAVKDRGILGLT